MLPEALSNGLCSLVPGEERLCMCCELRVSDKGVLSRTRFFEGVMRSAARLTYGEVGEFLERRDARPTARLQPLRERLLALHGVYRALTMARSGRGALELDTPELKLKFDSDGRIAAIVEQPRNDAHRLIEECMIAANVAAARFLDRHRMPTLYRVHGLPELDRLETLRQFLREFGLWLPPAADVRPEHLRELLQQIGDRPDATLISTAVIRTMPQAVYQPGNIGHFGLALDHYAHFTSPIRRYPDLVVHRGIRQVLRAGESADLLTWHGPFAALGQDCSFRERRADEATRSAVSWLKCFYMQEHIGREFDGIVSGVVDFGLFVQLEGLQVDGLAARFRARAGLLRARFVRVPDDRSQLRKNLPPRRPAARAREQRLARRPANRFRAGGRRRADTTHAAAMDRAAGDADDATGDRAGYLRHPRGAGAS